MIEPVKAMENADQAWLFFDNIKKELEKYVPVTWINCNSVNRYKNEINEESFLILLNDKSDFIKGSEFYGLLAKAKENNAVIWAIAFDKESRIPADMISEYQSYDVWEQLRCRNLNGKYIDSIAKDCSRKIISRALPMVYSEKGQIFVSHRRIDGEEIAAGLCDKIQQQSKQSIVFRDVVDVEAGEKAQEVIDCAMAESDAFLFIHTEKSSESKWIQKELRYALLRSIPVVWVRIGEADISKLKIKPAENPNLEYSLSDFKDERKLGKIADEILNMVFQIIMRRNDKIFDYLNSIKELFGNQLVEIKKTNLIYAVSVPRKNYHYPQREIRQYFQLYGKTPAQADIDALKEIIKKDNIGYDSVLILKKYIVKSNHNDKIVHESFQNFYYNWKQYLMGSRSEKNKEIVISGAFPDGDEICKQSLTDALIIFVRSILRDGYVVTFGSHPTFQELFFEVAKEVYPEGGNQHLKMYISKWLEDKYSCQRDSFLSNAQLIETSKKKSLKESLTMMRKKMIQRKKVAALLCFGGKIKKDKTEEGIREEIRMAQEFEIPVFAAGSVGGCSSVIAAENKANCWKELNRAPEELNRMFMEEMDYFYISQELLKYLHSLG